MNRFHDRYVIVTGAGSGIGRATAVRLASEGASVGCVDWIESSLTGTNDLIAAAGGRSQGYVCDISDPEQVIGTVGRILADADAVHALVNIAGIGVLAHSTEQPFAEWARIINVNLTGTFLMCQAVLPSLLESHGRIVNMASVAGLIGQPYNAAYCASKGGVIALTRALASEYIERGVTVNAIAAAGIETPLIENVEFPEGANPKLFEKLMSPMGMAQPEEVAGLVAYLLSDEARYMTGSIVTMDGGVTV